MQARGEMQLDTTRPTVDLRAVQWDSDECDCRVEVRQYVIAAARPEVVRTPTGITVTEPRIWCHLHRVDGSIEPVQMRYTTIDDMVCSGLQPEYWAWQKRRNLEQVAGVEKILEHIGDRVAVAEIVSDTLGIDYADSGLPDPHQRDLWQVLLENIRIGRTSADDDGYRRSPGTQLRGHLSHRCPRHGNQTSTSLSSQLSVKLCGCQVTEITVGEYREHGITHKRIEGLCPAHARMSRAQVFLHLGMHAR